MAEHGFLRSRWTVASLATLSFGLLLGGCSSDDGGDTGDTGDTGDGGTSPEPTQEAFEGRIEITNPQPGANLTLDYDSLTAVVAYEVDSFVLAAANTCADPDKCGHVELLIDGEAGNADGQDYNASGHQTTLSADFSEVDNPLGAHTITVKLVYDDGTDTGVEDSVEVNTIMPAPVVAITSPTPTTSTIILPESETVEVTFATTNLTLAEPGTCGDTPNCGHIYVYLDGEAGNAPDAEYNNISYDANEPISVNLGYAETATGPHEVRLSFRNDDGTPFLYGGELPIEATLQLNITSPDDPRIEITNLVPSDTDGDGQDDPPVINVAADGLRSFPIEFSHENFTFSMDCNGAAKCGHVHVSIDADNPINPDLGNAPGESFNNEGTGTSTGSDSREIDAHFHWLEYNANTVAGVRTVRLSLHDDDHNPIEASGVPVESIAVANVVPNPETLYLTVVTPGSNATVPHSDDDDMAVNVNYGLNVPDDLDVEFGLPDDPAGCTPTAKLCLHLRLFIDGDNGNQPSADYNNISEPQFVQQGLTVQALFGYLEENGYGGDLYDQSHHIVIALYREDGTPYTLENEDGTETVVSAGTIINIVEPGQPGGN